MRIVEFENYLKVLKNLNEQIKSILFLLNYKFSYCVLHTKFSMGPYQRQHKTHTFLQTELDFHPHHKMHLIYLTDLHNFTNEYHLKFYQLFFKQYI